MIVKFFTRTRLKPQSLIQTLIVEDPRRDVCPCAHDVLDIQTGLNTGLSCCLSADNRVHLGEMLEASAEDAHELCQVCRVEVLLQELKEKTAS